MDVIDAYLTTMFSPYPATARMVEAKAELRQMMEDAYQAARERGASETAAVGEVISAFGSLDELADELGIIAEVSVSPTADEDRALTLDEAQSYAETIHRTRWLLGGAIALFIISPIALITFTVLTNGASLPIFVGLAFLIVLVAVGVVLLVTRSAALAPHRRIVDGRFARSPKALAWAQEQARAHAGTRTGTVSVAVLLWILAGLPLIGGALASDARGRDWLVVLGLDVTLIMVAAGVLVWMLGNAPVTVYERLSHPGHVSDEETDSPVANAVLGAYWPLVTVGYLAWSFLGNAWDTSWVIWPIAGVFFAALAVLVKAFADGRRETR
ncbi:MAG TPA: hypothetical protein GX406_05750 [Pseudoclavibacter sp.]|nr:hypothetical protein [Pseudoclavibacter sp.]